MRMPHVCSFLPQVAVAAITALTSVIKNSTAQVRAAGWACQRLLPAVPCARCCACSCGQRTAQVCCCSACSLPHAGHCVQTMMGLEKELKDAAASLQRCNPTAISLKAGCELFLRCALLSVCASERCGIGMLGLPFAQLPPAAAGCCDAAGGRPLHGLPGDACAAPSGGRCTPPPVQGPTSPASCQAEQRYDSSLSWPAGTPPAPPR